jgi:hypothetical protein
MAAKQNGITVVRTQCVETFGEIEPWYPVLEALSRISNGPSRADLLEALEAVAPTWLVQLPVLTKAAHRDILRQEVLAEKTPSDSNDLIAWAATLGTI